MPSGARPRLLHYFLALSISLGLRAQNSWPEIRLLSPESDVITINGEALTLGSLSDTILPKAVALTNTAAIGFSTSYLILFSALDLPARRLNYRLQEENLFRDYRHRKTELKSLPGPLGSTWMWDWDGTVVYLDHNGARREYTLPMIAEKTILVALPAGLLIASQTGTQWIPENSLTPVILSDSEDSLRLVCFGNEGCIQQDKKGQLLARTYSGQSWKLPPFSSMGVWLSSFQTSWGWLWMPDSGLVPVEDLMRQK